MPDQSPTDLDRVARSAIGRTIRAGVYVQTTLAGANDRAPSGDKYDLKMIASTGRVARDAGVIEAGAWNKDLRLYHQNPVVLWAHDYRCPPIATALDTVADSKRGSLTQYWRFLSGISSDPWDAFCARVKALYAVGGMRASSVGFLIIDAKRAEREDVEKAIKAGEREPMWVCTRAELLEVSAVPVPADPGALQVDRALREARKKGADVRSLDEAWQALQTTRSLPAVLEQALTARRSVAPWAGAPDISALVQQDVTLAETTAATDRPAAETTPETVEQTAADDVDAHEPAAASDAEAAADALEAAEAEAVATVTLTESEADAGDAADAAPTEPPASEPGAEVEATADDDAATTAETPDDATPAVEHAAPAAAVRDTLDAWLSDLAQERTAEFVDDEPDAADWDLPDLVTPRGASESAHPEPAPLALEALSPRAVIDALPITADQLRQIVREEMRSTFERTYLASLGRTK